MAKSLKQAYDYWQNRPDLNCGLLRARTAYIQNTTRGVCVSYRETRAQKRLMILMVKSIIYYNVEIITHTRDTFFSLQPHTPPRPTTTRRASI